MNNAAPSDSIVAVIRRARDLVASRGVRDAIDLLTESNRHARSDQFERALVRIRRDAAQELAHTVPSTRERIVAEPSDGRVVEVEAADLSVASLRDGLARSGCLLVRGLVDAERVANLVKGIDSALASADAASGGAAPIDRGWYNPGPMPDRDASGLPASANRRFLRERGGLWTIDSPRMLFELFEVVDEVGIGSLMTDFLGERPLLSALKCTLRRVPPDLVVVGGWHQDGAFLGDHVGAFNLWLSLSHCGQDAPGLDILPKRVDRVLQSDDGSRFDWSLSDDAVRAAAGGSAIVRPEFRPGDALLFDHLLVHRTATSPEMTQPRHAIESWFFAPSAYPAGQLPILY